MRKAQWCGLVGLLGTLGLVGGLASPAQTPPAGEKGNKSLLELVAKESKQKQEVVEKVLKALAPAVREQLAAGSVVSLPGLGSFQVVRVAEHKDLVGGKPVRVPAANYIEFVPAAELNNAAGSPSAVPARTVPAFEYVPRAGMVPGVRTEGRKVGRTRTP
jgi:nucleoid DNA-binding protein